MTKINEDIANLEWDWLNNQKTIPTESKEIVNITVTTSKTFFSLDPSESKVLFWRDERFQLKMKLSIGYDSFAKAVNNTDPQFSSIQDEVINITITENNIDDRSSTYQFINCGCIDKTILLKNCISKTENPLSYTFLVSRITIDYHRTSEETRLSEWYINGNSNLFIFSNSLRYSIDTSYKWSKPGISDFETKGTKDGVNYFRNCSLIPKTDSTPSFILGLVPDTYNTAKSKNMFIEYHTELSEIPERDMRSSIAEITSFLLGKELLNIGNTSYDSSGNIREIELYSLYPYYNIPFLLSQFPTPPIEIKFTSKETDIRQVLPRLLEKYLTIKENYYLKAVFDRYWIASQLPIETQVVVLQNGFEILIKRILHKDESYGFPNMLRDLSKKVRLKISGDEFKTNKLRNDCAHETLDFENDKDEIIHQYYVLFSLFNRVILHLFGYSGEYYDYSQKAYMGDRVKKSIFESAGVNEEMAETK